MRTIPDLNLRIALGVILILLAVSSAMPLIPPPAVAADTPADRFSAGRAMSDLEIIAKEPHAAGSEPQARVRAYIVKELESLGLSPEIQTSGQLSNILLRLPGTNSTGMLLVTAHYDSHPPAPGAGDNGIGTAALLESIRVLHARPRLRNDLLFLFTDGEELGWKGAMAFIKANPEARQQTGALLVFDARPGNAAMRLSETSPGDGWLVGQLWGLPLNMMAGSWENREERTELDTDFDTFQPAGYTGMVVENEGAGTRYHDERDTVDAISPAVVQNFGESMLLLTGRFGNRDLSAPAKSPDAVYFNMPLAGIVSYPGWLMAALSSFGLLALLALMFLGWRTLHFSIKHWLLAILGLLLGIVLLPLVSQLAWGLILKGHASEVAIYDGFESSPTWLGGMMIAAALLMIVLLYLLSRRLGSFNLAAAGAVLYMLIWVAVFVLMDHHSVYCLVIPGRGHGHRRPAFHEEPFLETGTVLHFRPSHACPHGSLAHDDHLHPRGCLDSGPSRLRTDGTSCTAGGSNFWAGILAASGHASRLARLIGAKAETQQVSLRSYSTRPVCRDHTMGLMCHIVSGFVKSGHIHLELEHNRICVSAFHE
jgi:hypothetical protein